MTTTSFTEWLRANASRDALLSAWRNDASSPTLGCETDALAIAALATKSAHDAAIAHPGGRSRLPLLAAVHAAALQLPGFPSPLASRRHGPAVLATRQIVRRDEVQRVNAKGIPISPALHPVRLRTDGLCAPLNGGRPGAIELTNRLIFARDLPPDLPLSPAVVIIDGGAEDDTYVQSALGWARSLGAPAVIFEDSAQRRLQTDVISYSCGWAAINVEQATVPDPVVRLAQIRGHASVINAGAQYGLAKAATLLSDARRRRQSIPEPLLSAATLWRRLDELAVPLDIYDAACPRWHSPTLSERLDDLCGVGVAAFPTGWHTWAEMCWAGIKEGLASTREALSEYNPKASLLVDVVDAQLSGGRPVDITLPSRIARDATLRQLAAAGVVMPVDGRLVVRSLGDPDSHGLRHPTLLIAPPGSALRHRLTAGDIGPLNVLCYEHEVNALRSVLAHNLDEQLIPGGPILDLTPAGRDLQIDQPVNVPDVVLTVATTHTAINTRTAPRLVDRSDLADAAGLAALTSATGPVDLPDGEGDEDPHSRTARLPAAIAVVPLTVVAIGDDRPRVACVPVNRTIVRILGSRATRVPVLAVEPTMLVADIEGPVAFERLRSMLTDVRGGVTRMLLAAWAQALDTAMTGSGGARELARRLSSEGSTVGSNAVAAWSDADRIGPRDPGDIARVGRIAAHPIVEHNAAAIADTMGRLRTLHQEVGRVITATIAGDEPSGTELEKLLGPDALSVVNETVVYRVLKVGVPAESPRNSQTERITELRNERDTRN